MRDEISENEPILVYEDIEGGELYIYPRCGCGKFLKHGKVFVNVGGRVKFDGWTCSEHGEVDPGWDRV